MPEIRKLLRLSKSAFAVTLPAKYRRSLDLGFGNYVVISQLDEKTIAVRKHQGPEKI